MLSTRRLVLAASICLLLPFTALSQWQIYSSTAEGSTSTEPYYGFPFSLSRPPVTINTNNSSNCVHDPCFTDPATGSCGIRAKFQSGSSQQDVVFSAPNAQYWNYQWSTVGKVLTDGTYRFYNPRFSQYYKYIMYFGSQQLTNALGMLCSHSGWGSATSQTGYSFVHAQLSAALLRDCDASPCYNYNWYCANGFPCDTNQPRQWWTSAEIFAPLIFQSDNKLYAAVFAFNRTSSPTQPYSDCTRENSLCWPSNPSHAGTVTYFLKSTDGIVWSRHIVQGSDHNRLSVIGIDASSPCWNAPWLINIDLAYDPPTGDFYMTRSYPSDQAASEAGGCSPALVPDHIQLYKTHLSTGLFFGPWQLLFDGGCSNLGYRPDSASILHDGKGNAIKGQNGSITLLISASGRPVGNCPLPQFPRRRVVVGP